MKHGLLRSPAHRTIRCARARGGPCHLAAFLGAAAAGFRTLLAVVSLVPRAFLATRIAKVGANLADALGEIGTPRHLAFRQCAEISAAAIKFDAAGHHLDVLFVQTRGRTVFTFDGAGVAGFDAIAVFFVGHDFLPG